MVRLIGRFVRVMHDESLRPKHSLTDKPLDCNLACEDL